MQILHLMYRGIALCHLQMRAPNLNIFARSYSYEFEPGHNWDPTTVRGWMPKIKMSGTEWPLANHSDTNMHNSDMATATTKTAENP